MKSPVKTFAPALISLLLVTAGAARLHAQITNPIQAHIDHSFLIGDKTLPPGDYTFRVEENSDLGVMEVQNKSGEHVAQFNVRRSVDNHRPKHSEIVFRKFGDTEFLSKVYEAGSKTGVSLTETSKQEAQLASGGQRAIEHTEEQP
jgi:hypothetical protein